MSEDNKMIIYYVKIDENRNIIDFSNEDKEDYIKVQVYSEWNELFCLATTSFQLDEDNGLVPPKNGYSATWKKFNEVMPIMEAVQKKNEELQATLDKSDAALEKTNTQLDQADEKINQLQQMITFMSNQGGGTDE